MSRVGSCHKYSQGVKISQQELELTVAGPKGTLARFIPEHLRSRLPTSRFISGGRAIPARHAPSTGSCGRWCSTGTGSESGLHQDPGDHRYRYRAEVQNNFLNLSLGYSHPINFELPAGVTATVERQNVIRLEAIDKELLDRPRLACVPCGPLNLTRVKASAMRERVHRKVGKAGPRNRLNKDGNHGFKNELA